jgi:hypothetical protein
MLFFSFSWSDDQSEAKELRETEVFSGEYTE